MIKKLKQAIASEKEDTGVLLRSIPAMTMVLFCISVVLMNLLANKELLNLKYIALDCGFAVSWISFLAMDVLTRRFGARAAIKLSIIAIIVNFGFSALLFLLAKVPGNWGEYYNYGDVVVNQILDSTIGGTWYIVCGSMLAFACGSIANAVLNVNIAKILTREHFSSFVIISAVSTTLGQFVDNFVFAFTISRVFFGWTMLQVVTCSMTGAILELIAELVFTPIGYKMLRNWISLGIGNEYKEYVRRQASYKK